MTTTKQTLILIPSLIAIHLSLISPAYAQSATSFLGMSAIPPRLEVTANPGQVVTKEIKIRNDSAVEKIITINVKDFIVTDDSGTPIQLDNNSALQSQNRWAASSWIQISNTNLKLKPGETKALALTVLVPDNALPGGHYAMILSTPNTEATLNQTSAVIQANVGTLVYITVPGNIKQNAVIKNFSAPFFSEYGPIDFKSTIANFSDIHITPAGSINIKNWLGGKTATLKLDTTNIFPYTSRDFQNTLKNRWLFGRYQAQLQAVYGTNGSTVLATLYFWVIPWRLIILIITAIAIIIALILINKDRFRKNETQVSQLEKELNDLKNKYKDHK